MTRKARLDKASKKFLQNYLRDIITEPAAPVERPRASTLEDVSKAIQQMEAALEKARMLELITPLYIDVVKQLGEAGNYLLERGHLQGEVVLDDTTQSHARDLLKSLHQLEQFYSEKSPLGGPKKTIIQKHFKDFAKEVAAIFEVPLAPLSRA